MPLTYKEKGSTVTYSIKIADADQMCRTVFDNSGAHPPRSVYHAIISLAGDPNALQEVLCERETIDDETRWIVLGRTASALIYVIAVGKARSWDYENDHDSIERRLDAAWIRPLSDLAEVRVTEVTPPRRFSYSLQTEWNWDARFELTVGDRTVPVPDFTSANSLEKQTAGKVFMSNLLVVLGGEQATPDPRGGGSAV